MCPVIAKAMAQYRIASMKLGHKRARSIAASSAPFRLLTTSSAVVQRSINDLEMVVDQNLTSSSQFGLLLCPSHFIRGMQDTAAYRPNMAAFRAPGRISMVAYPGFLDLSHQGLCGAMFHLDNGSLCVASCYLRGGPKYFRMSTRCSAHDRTPCAESELRSFRQHLPPPLHSYWICQTT
jgi:hypothetical protein